ncbi:MAG: hypothetical protein HN337_02610 [Deltaproteobacteria bacterium]|nr:hypothetical protein [Deltaproteobacteria bacterium]
MSVPRATKDHRARHCQRIDNPQKREYCEGYVAQCVDQLVGGKKNPDSSTFILQSESGTTAEGLDYDRCLSLTSFFSNNGKPKKIVVEESAAKEPEKKPTDKRRKRRKPKKTRKPKKRRLRFKCRMGFKALVAMPDIDFTRYQTWKRRRCKK